MACPEFLGPLAQELLDCYTVALVDCERPACRYFLASSGTPAWDECCDCGTGNGQAWVALASIDPINTGAQTPCAWEYEALFQVGVLRCAVTQNGDGTPPAADDLTAEALAQMLDAEIARRAILCCFAEGKDPGDFTLGAWTALGPDGGCVGGQTEVRVRFSGCSCPED